MNSINTYDDAERFFLLYAPAGMHREYSLDLITELMQRLGNPHNLAKVIHVAGTSGKTSTTYLIRALLQQAGVSTGMLVSPHIENIAERAQVNGALLPELEYCQYVSEFQDLVGQWPDLTPSYFELTTAFAYWLFAKLGLEYAVIETGMGGLLDASNVAQLPNKICVITPIGYDHMEFLGDTLEQIATQKAGIIHKGNQAFVSSANKSLSNVFSGAAICWQKTFPVMDFLPKYQQENWNLARTVYDALAQRDSLPELSQAQLTLAARMTPPGRYETYRIGKKSIILDGAHNPQKLEAFIRSLPEAVTSDSAWLIGFTEGQDTRLNDCLPQIAKLHAPVVCTDYQVGQDFSHRQGTPSRELADRCRNLGIDATAEPDMERALENCLKRHESTTVVTGSLYLISCIRPLVKARSMVK